MKQTAPVVYLGNTLKVFTFYSGRSQDCTDKSFWGPNPPSPFLRLRRSVGSE